MTLLATGKKIDAAKTDVVGGWAAVNETAQGPKVYDLASTYIRRQQVVRFDGSRAVRVITWSRNFLFYNVIMCPRPIWKNYG